MKQRFVDRSETSNIAIILKPKMAGLRAYKKINLMIDNVKVMNFINDGSMWTPNNEIRIFDSFLPFGDHTYEVHTTLMIDKQEKDTIKPLYTKTYHTRGNFKLDKSDTNCLRILKLVSLNPALSSVSNVFTTL